MKTITDGLDAKCENMGLYGLSQSFHSFWAEQIIRCYHKFDLARRGSSIGCTSAWYVDGHRFDPDIRQNILLWRFGHENEKISMAILHLPLIQEWQLSVNWRKNVH